MGLISHWYLLSQSKPHMSLKQIYFLNLMNSSRQFGLEQLSILRNHLFPPKISKINPFKFTCLKEIKHYDILYHGHIYVYIWYN